MRFRATHLLISSMALASIGCKESRQVGEQKAASTFPNPGPQSHQLSVKSGTTFILDGQACKLLGVAESKDVTVRKRALEYSANWFKASGLLAVINANNPLRDADGTCIVWMVKQNSRNECLNVELVRNGLAILDIHPWEDYAFTEDDKSLGAVPVKWREALAVAAKEGVTESSSR